LYPLAGVIERLAASYAERPAGHEGQADYHNQCSAPPSPTATTGLGVAPNFNACLPCLPQAGREGHRPHLRRQRFAAIPALCSNLLSAGTPGKSTCQSSSSGEWRKYRCFPCGVPRRFQSALIVLRTAIKHNQDSVWPLLAIFSCQIFAKSVLNDQHLYPNISPTKSVGPLHKRHHIHLSGRVPGTEPKLDP
jgi:hypothetical protein